MQATVTVTGVEAAIREALRIGGRVEREAKREIVKAAMHTERDAKRAAPVGDSGILRSSIHANYDQVESDAVAYVDVNASYAAFVEYGTGRAGASSNAGDLPATYTHGPKPGMRAQPFLFPAAEKNGQKLLGELRRLLRNPDRIT